MDCAETQSHEEPKELPRDPLCSSKVLDFFAPNMLGPIGSKIFGYLDYPSKVSFDKVLGENGIDLCGSANMASVFGLRLYNRDKDYHQSLGSPKFVPELVLFEHSMCHSLRNKFFDSLQTYGPTYDDSRLRRLKQGLPPITQKLQLHGNVNGDFLGANFISTSITLELGGSFASHQISDGTNSRVVLLRKNDSGNVIWKRQNNGELFGKELNMFEGGGEFGFFYRHQSTKRPNRYILSVIYDDIGHQKTIMDFDLNSPFHRPAFQTVGNKLVLYGCMVGKEEVVVIDLPDCHLTRYKLEVNCPSRIPVNALFLSTDGPNMNFVVLHQHNLPKKYVLSVRVFGCNLTTYKSPLKCTRTNSYKDCNFISMTGARSVFVDHVKKERKLDGDVTNVSTIGVIFLDLTRRAMIDAEIM